MSPLERVTISAAFLIAVAMTWGTLKLAQRIKLIDKPSLRSSHSTPTPRGGGIAIVVAFFTALLALQLTGNLRGQLADALLYGGSAVAIVGIVDDRWSLKAAVRFLVHLGAAATAVWLVGVPTIPFWQFDAQYLWTARIIAIVSIAWGINLFNFMDGIDGIATLEVVFFAGAAACLNSYIDGDPILNVVWLTLASASLGFLVWNWPPARIFMGDVGSGFLGFVVTTIALAMSRERPVAIAISLILGGVFVVDASITVIRRMIRGDRWVEAHRMHAYQHLARRWQSHRRVTLLVTAINVTWLLPWAFAAAKYPPYAAIHVVVALLPLGVLAIAAGAGAPESAAPFKTGRT
jgi:Fuc2NAc and GlcNAc transferase